MSNVILEKVSRNFGDRVVVMDHGRIQQIGSPEEIYRYPANRTVAAFFGTPNLLEANVETCARLDRRRVRLEVVGRGWRGPCEAASKVRPGQPVTVMVRPEDARIASPGLPVRSVVPEEGAPY